VALHRTLNANGTVGGSTLQQPASLCPGSRPEGAPYLAFYWPDVGDADLREMPAFQLDPNPERD
jgi:hypothetical protein